MDELAAIANREPLNIEHARIGSPHQPSALLHNATLQAINSDIPTLARLLGEALEEIAALKRK